MRRNRRDSKTRPSGPFGTGPTVAVGPAPRPPMGQGKPLRRRRRMRPYLHCGRASRETNACNLTNKLSCDFIGVRVSAGVSKGSRGPLPPRRSPAVIVPCFVVDDLLVRCRRNSVELEQLQAYLDTKPPRTSSHCGTTTTQKGAI